MGHQIVVRVSVYCAECCWCSSCNWKHAFILQMCSRSKGKRYHCFNSTAYGAVADYTIRHSAVVGRAVCWGCSWERLLGYGAERVSGI